MLRAQTRFLFRAATATAGLATASISMPPTVAGAARASYATSSSSSGLYEHTVVDINGADLPLEELSGDVILVTNVASR